MNPSLAQIISKLKCSEESVQNEGVAQLALLFEWHAHPERGDATWQMILPDDLLKARLSQREISDLLNEVISVVVAEPLYHSSKLSLMGVIARNCSDENAEALLKFFSEFAEDYSEEQAYGFLADFTRFLLRIENTHRFQTLLTRYGTMQLLEKLRANGSPRLQESAARVLNHLRKHPE